MHAKDVIVLLSAMAVSGCSDPVRYTTPAMDPDELALSASGPSPPPVQNQESER